MNCATGETLRGAMRAQGALASFLGDMTEKLEKEGRSIEYKRAFWSGLGREFEHYLKESQ